MSTITILGAGAMGSALTMPLATNQNNVKIWGTEFDDSIIKALKAGKPHPKHQLNLPPAVQAYAKDELQQAMEGAQIVIMAIASEGLGAIFKRAVPYLRPGMIIGSVTKGFDYNADGKIVLLPEILEEALPPALRGDLPFVFVGGPCKAIEVLWEVPTSVTYASQDLKAAKTMQKAAQTSVYRVETTTDVIGTELCAAMKNAYSVGLGLAEGFAKRKGRNGRLHKNTKGALFTFAIAEMAILTAALGGTMGPVYGLPGAGDLELTGEAGRNRTLGEVIGGGLSASQAIAKMKAEDITVEGYPAIKFGYLLAQELAKDGKLQMEQLPLLKGMYDILYQDASAYERAETLLQECTGAY